MQEHLVDAAGILQVAQACLRKVHARLDRKHWTRHMLPPSQDPPSLLCLQMWQGGWRRPDLRQTADGPNQAAPLPGTDCQGRRLLPDSEGSISYLLCEFLLHEGAQSSDETLDKIAAACGRQAAALSGQADCGRDPCQLVATNMQAGVDCLLGEVVRCTGEISLLGHLERNRPGPPGSTTPFGAGGAAGAPGVHGQAPVLPCMPPEKPLPSAGKNSAPGTTWVPDSPVGQLQAGSLHVSSACCNEDPVRWDSHHLGESLGSPQWEIQGGAMCLL